MGSEGRSKGSRLPFPLGQQPGSHSSATVVALLSIPILPMTFLQHRVCTGSGFLARFPIRKPLDRQ